MASSSKTISFYKVLEKLFHSAGSDYSSESDSEYENSETEPCKKIPSLFVDDRNLMTNAETNVVDDDMESEDGDQMVIFSYKYCLLWENCIVTICDIAVFLGFCSSLANTQHTQIYGTYSDNTKSSYWFLSFSECALSAHITFFLYLHLIFYL